MVSIIAMILPGISGGFIFILFGVYEYIIKTINDFTNKVIEFDFKSLDDILYRLIIIVLGIITGLKLFSKILKWLIENHEKKTLSILMGIMIGSLPEIWPLKTYHSMGAWVSDHAVVDLNMKTLHLFTGMEISKIPKSRKKFLLNLA